MPLADSAYDQTYGYEASSLAICDWPPGSYNTAGDAVRAAMYILLRRMLYNELGLSDATGLAVE